ncbi:DUF6010 family protein [Gemmatimonadota bacterium]
MLKGLLAGGITMGVAAVFPETLVFPFFAVVLGVAAGIYPGMAMASSEGGYPAVEWMAALGFVAMGMVGLWVSPLYLAVAWLLHGLWDLLHHITALGDGIPEGYPGFCLAYDVVIGGFVAYMWAMGV